MTSRYNLVCAADDIDRTLADLDKQSESSAVLFFKHSARCGISLAALKRLEAEWNVAEANTYLYKKSFLCIDVLDASGGRLISNALAERYGIIHASPQVLLIVKGACVYDASHENITYAGVSEALRLSCGTHA